MKLWFNIIATILVCLSFMCHKREKIIIKDTKNYIAFSRTPEVKRGVDDNVWLINTENGEEVLITEDRGYCEYKPVWINDSELLYLLEPQQNPMDLDIVFLKLNTGGRKRMNFSPWTYHRLSMDKISIDSAKNMYFAAFVADEAQFAIYRISLKQEDPTPEEVLSPEDIKQFGLANVGNPVIGSNGTKLLLVACDTAKYRRIREIGKIARYDIYLYDLQADTIKKALKRLTSGDSIHKYPVWLDDNNIIFTSDRDGNYELYKMNIKNRSLKRLTFSDHTEDTEAAVSPDGEKIAYSRYDKELKKIEIWLMDLETKKAWFLTKGSDPDWSPAR